MKSIIKALLYKFGIVAMKRSSHVYLPEGESYRIALEQCGEVEPVVIDGGAHRGSTVDAFRGLVPQARFHCFEPDPELAAGLRERFSGDRHVHVVEAALGAESGRAVFNINASRPTNSLLPTAADLQPDLQDLCSTVDQVDVDVMAIDDYCRQMAIEKVDIIKLDLQGYDYLALKGASKTLAQTQVVLAEAFFTEVYRGGHLFPDIMRFMEAAGFRLFTLSGIHYGTRDELLWADAIFVKEPAQRPAALVTG